MGSGYDVELQLGDIGHLFTKPDISPLSDDYEEYSYTSGLEFIADELYANSSYSQVKATIVLPGEGVEPGLESRVREGVKRYCRGRLKDIEHEIRATRWRGLRALIAGFGALFLFIGASRILDRQEHLTLQILGQGLAVAGWVALWFPLESLSFKVWEHRLDKKIYTLLSQMEITISPME